MQLLNEEKKIVPSVEQSHFALDGRDILVELSAVPFRFQGSDGAVVFARDITEKKRVEEELRQNVSVVRALLENSPNLISVFDAEGRYVLVSKENARAIGQAPDHIVGQIFDEIFPPSMAKRFKQRIHRIVAGEDSFSVQDEMGVGDTKRYFDTWLFPVVRQGGNVKLIGSIALDVTERVVAQQNLQAWDDLMQYIIHHDPSAIAVFDREMRFVYVSQRFLNDYGVAQDVIGRNHYEVFPDIPEKWREVHRKALRGEVQRNDDDFFVRADGRVEYTRWQCCPWHDAHGTIGGIVLYTEVITPLKRVEMELRELNQQLEQRVKERTARLEEVNQELEAFSYSVSHDLRAPLRGIDGFSQALLEDYHDKLDGQGRDYLDRVRKASQRMGLLIDDLLKLSRVSRAELTVAKVNLSRLAEGVLTGLVESEPDRDVEAVVEQGLSATADPTLIQVVLENLLDNAWKFTRYNPRPRVEFGRRMVNDEQVFFLKDNGAGFDMTYAEKLFTAFQRLHSPERFPGTGIGLATTARIIRRHGGRIWAEAEPDKGATFFFTLPDVPTAEDQLV